MNIKKSRVCAIIFVWQILTVLYFLRRKEKDTEHGLTSICCQEQTKSCLACQRRISEEDFCLMYFGMFDCPPEEVARDNEGVQKKAEHGLDVMLAVDVLQQNGLSQFTATVMRQYLNISAADIYIFSSSAMYDGKRDSQWWRTWYGEEVNILSPSLNLTMANRYLFKTFLESKYDVVLLLKSDMVLLKDWTNFVKDNIHRTDGALSLYRRAHNYETGSTKNELLNNECPKFHDGLCEGEDEFETNGVVLTKNITKILLKNGEHYLAENGVKMSSDVERFRLFYSPTSLAIRISQRNQTVDHCGWNETPHKFNRCVLPEWIQSGIQYYFDRCTDPEEVFSFKKFKFDQLMRQRFWARPAISYSLFGNTSIYTSSALVNAQRMSSIYPGWKMWIYHDHTVPSEVLSKLCHFNVHFINMTGSRLKNGMTWRFLVASEPVHFYAIRDIDSRILAREKEAVDEWILSGKLFHIMRDSKVQSANPISAGMWGGRHDAVPDMRQLLMKERFGQDHEGSLKFLNRVIWPIANQSFRAHDSHPTGQWGDFHPFPLES